ncbi:MAG: hypothetical protein DI533_16735 [Cereibacter sphaeroides]|uniref:Beta-lactamase-related domain-containing protein n=1 Tax=Cereibacter sphaeroides TaxID=1063 RepID=A0A2W5S4X7_CERSP|nr:MAG: hypothetical protein DI533_16735 [Cereibacter sphaeroides]
MGAEIDTYFPDPWSLVPPERTAVLNNWRKPPQNRWALRNVSKLLTTELIDRRSESFLKLEEAPRNLSGVTFPADGTANTLGAFLPLSHTDGFLALHRGKVAFEYYTPGMAPDERHVMFSVSKSVLGMVFGTLQAKGLVDPARLIIDYVPELAGSAYADATVQHALDISVEVEFDETYSVVGGDVDQYRRVNGWDPVDDRPPHSAREYLRGLKRAAGDHGTRFHYVSPDTDVAAWAAERVSGQSYARLVQDFLWKPIGAEHSAYMTVDRFGVARAAGGLCATLRDMGRIALAMSGDPRLRGVLPQAFLDDTFHAADPAVWARGLSKDYIPGGRYRNSWYLTRGDAALAIGIHGQWLYVDPARQVVIVKQASQPLASEPATDHASMAAFEAIAKALN